MTGMNWHKFQRYLEDEYDRLIVLSVEYRSCGNPELAKSTTERASIALMLAHAVEAGLK
jgi:hypothetical protein